MSGTLVLNSDLAVIDQVSFLTTQAQSLIWSDGVEPQDILGPSLSVFYESIPQGSSQTFTLFSRKTNPR